MNAFRTLLASAALGLAALVVSPAPAQADDYWDGYWGWYDNTYRPYYYRQYSRYPAGGGYTYGHSAYAYPGYSYGSPYYGGASPYWGGRYGGAYYGTPNAGYSDFGRYGGRVNVGPLSFGWR